MRPASSRALKVMHVVNRMAMGGMEKGVLKVATQLSEGLEHRICCIRGYDASFIQGRLRPEQLVALNLPGSRFSLSVPKLARAIREYNPDIVHSRNWGAIEAVLAARLVGVPVVIHSEHGYEVNLMAKTPLRQRCLRRVVLSAADAVFAVSRELGDFHARQAGVRNQRLRVIYNGVDTQRFTPNPEARARTRAVLGFSSQDVVLGAVGRMVPIKDYVTLIKAAAVLAQKNRAFKLLLVGDGPELPCLLDLAKKLLGGPSDFISLGKCANIPELLCAMDVFVQTSLSEGMSNTILEAMAAGLPVIVTRVGGNPEIVEDGKSGWLFTPGDVQHLAQLVLELAADDRLRQGTGQAARQRVQYAFSDENMLANYRQLYLNLMQEREVSTARLPGSSDVQPARSVRP